MTFERKAFLVWLAAMVSVFLVATVTTTIFPDSMIQVVRICP